MFSLVRSICFLYSMLLSSRIWEIFLPVAALTSGTPSWSRRARPICAGALPVFASSVIFFSIPAADFVAIEDCCLIGS